MEDSLKKEINNIAKYFGIEFVSENFIREFEDKVNWIYISKYQKLSEDFIREFKDRVNWYYISAFQKPSEDFIREFKDRVCWSGISQNQKLSEDFIREFKDKINCCYISKYQKLSEDFIREFKDRVCWDCISQNQKLSEDFIREFKDYVHWGYISINQKLSENLIKEFKDKVDWTYILTYQNLSEGFVRGFKNEVHSYFIQTPKTKTNEQKLKEIKEYAKEYNLQFDGEWLYAYREHDKWNRGVFNKTISYDKFNHEYRDWHCDINPFNENSFGLGIWPKKRGVNVKVKVHYKDWGVGPVDANGKGRVWAFTLIENI